MLDVNLILQLICVVFDDLPPIWWLMELLMITIYACLFISINQKYIYTFPCISNT